MQVIRLHTYWIYSSKSGLLSQTLVGSIHLGSNKPSWWFWWMPSIENYRDRIEVFKVCDVEREEIGDWWRKDSGLLPLLTPTCVNSRSLGFLSQGLDWVLPLHSGLENHWAVHISLVASVWWPRKPSQGDNIS